jgi:acetyl esterase/lipase
MAEEDRSVFDLPTVDPTSTFNYGEFPEQVGDIFAPKVKKFNTLLVLIHGGYWRPEYDRVHLRPFAAALSELGYQVISLEYRRIPGNPDAMVADIDLAIKNLPSNDFILIGHSAGGHLALVACAKNEGVKTVIALAPVTSLLATYEMDLDKSAALEFLGEPANLRPDLDPMTFDPLSANISIIHGENDLWVPIELTRKYIEKLEGEGSSINYKELANIGHFEMIHPQSIVWSELISQINK